jgi:catechol 2,3-dioxygenase-like lactoylglutathione lyase family enzyme
MSILSLAHACIKTTSLEQTKSFYCDGFGFEKLFDFTRRGECVGFYLKAANRTFIEVFLEGEVENMDKRTLNHFCLETGDLKSLRQKLVDHGYTPGEIKMGADQTWQFWVTDPNGLAVEAQEYTPNSAQLTHKNVEVNW